jgi:hypothetical protein
MDKSQIKQLVVDAIANVTVATCTSGGLQTPSDFVTVIKVGIGMGAIIVPVYALYWNLQWICIATTDQPPNQQDGKTFHLHSVCRIMFFFHFIYLDYCWGSVMAACKLVRGLGAAYQFIWQLKI